MFWCSNEPSTPTRGWGCKGLCNFCGTWHRDKSCNVSGTIWCAWWRIVLIMLYILWTKSLCLKFHLAHISSLIVCEASRCWWIHKPQKIGCSHKFAWVKARDCPAILRWYSLPVLAPIVNDVFATLLPGSIVNDVLVTLLLAFILNAMLGTLFG